MKKYYVIPFFIPHQGCPFTCIFCSQKKISGRSHSIPVSKISLAIKQYLKTIPLKNTRREVAFFGGSFTGLPINKQIAYLEAVAPYIKNGSIHSIRLSTRPDYITQPILSMLKKYHVSTIELGVQSLDNDVLISAKRGHTSSEVKAASKLILKNGFRLGHQIMIGLPGSTLSKEIKTAKASIAMGAKQVRIYPLLVIKSTELASMWKKGLYKAISEPEAIRRSAKLVKIFKINRVEVLRCGLHPSEGLITGKDILSGPFHQAFGQKVESYIYGKMLRIFFKNEKNPESIKFILFNPQDTASVIGYKRENAVFAEEILKTPKIFMGSKSISRGTIVAKYTSGRKKIIGRL